MNSKNILIAAGMLVLASSLLTGCGLVEMMPGGSKTVSEQPAVKVETATEAAKPRIKELAQEAQQAKKTVDLKLDGALEDGKLTVSVMLENPEMKPVASAQTWLSFDTTVLKGVSISDEGSDFDLMAPYDNAFDDINGLAQIGRAATEAVEKEAIQVAEVTFEVIGEGALMVNAYDYRETLAGHMSANTIVDEKPYNIMNQPENPVLVINPSEQ